MTRPKLIRMAGTGLVAALACTGVLLAQPSPAATAAPAAPSAPCGFYTGLNPFTENYYNHCGPNDVIVKVRPAFGEYQDLCLPPGVTKLADGTGHAYSDGVPC